MSWAFSHLKVLLDMTMNEDRENVESRRKKMKRLGQWGWEGKDVQEPVTEVRRRARLEVRLEGTCLGFFFIVLIVLHLSPQILFCVPRS